MKALSASRIKTLQKCSWSYFCNYHLRLPDKGNDGANRGTICHLIFEVLGNPRHKKHYNKIIRNGDVFASKSVERLIMKWAVKLKVDDDDNMELIKKMTLNGLVYDFFGADEGKPTEALSEQDFDLIVEEDDKKYRIKGFIDKTFLYKRKKKVLIRDFKSSKDVFKGKDLSDNLQDLMYKLAISKIFPEYENREMEFLFLKFPMPGKGCQTCESTSNEELEGFEYQLTEIQKTIDNFDEGAGKKSFAAKKGFPKDGSFGGLLACGKDGYKIRKGEPLLDDNGQPIPAFICSHRKPMTYVAIVDKEDGTTKRSGFLEDYDEMEKNLKDGEEIKIKEYLGCPHFYKENY